MSVCLSVRLSLCLSFCQFADLFVSCEILPKNQEQKFRCVYCLKMGRSANRVGCVIQNTYRIYESDIRSTAGRYGIKKKETLSGITHYEISSFMICAPYQKLFES
jgi:hypothetical protein